MPKQLADGSILENRYVIEDKIGNGGMSNVYLVWDNKLSKRWAMKQIRLSEWKKVSFYREMELLKRVSYPAFPVMVDWFMEEEFGYLVMEWIQGETLEQFLQRKKRMDEAFANKVMAEVMDALSYLHSLVPAVIYGDLKPSNIILQRDGRVRMVDFGTACIGDDGCYMGTKGYAAPEFFAKMGVRPDVRSDIYSLGVVYYEVLTGKRFLGDYIENPFLSWQIREVIFNCTRVSPKKRYESIQAVRDAMNQQGKIPKRKQFLLRDCEKVILTETNLAVWANSD